MKYCSPWLISPHQLLFEVSIIETLSPSLSNLVSMVECSPYFFMLCNSSFRLIICFSIFSLSSFKIAFSLFFQNRCLFDLPILTYSSLVSFENYFWVKSEIKVDK